MSLFQWRGGEIGRRIGYGSLNIESALSVMKGEKLGELLESLLLNKSYDHQQRSRQRRNVQRLPVLLRYGLITGIKLGLIPNRNSAQPQMLYLGDDIVQLP